VYIDFRDFGRNKNRNNVIIGETMSVSVRVYWDCLLGFFSYEDYIISNWFYGCLYLRRWFLPGSAVESRFGTFGLERANRASEGECVILKEIRK
jgi:hypothetical protein